MALRGPVGCTPLIRDQRSNDPERLRAPCLELDQLSTHYFDRSDPPGELDTLPVVSSDSVNSSKVRARAPALLPDVEQAVCQPTPSRKVAWSRLKGFGIFSGLRVRETRILALGKSKRLPTEGTKSSERPGCDRQSAKTAAQLNRTRCARMGNGKDGGENASAETAVSLAFAVQSLPGTIHHRFWESSQTSRRE